MIKEIEEFIPFEDKMSNKMIRINLSKYHYDKLIDIISKSSNTDLLEAIEEKKTIIKAYQPNKVEAMEKATEARVTRAKKNIKLAFEYLVRTDKKVTQKAIAEASKCSVNTVRKYDYIWKNYD